VGEERERGKEVGKGIMQNLVGMSDAEIWNGLSIINKNHDSGCDRKDISNIHKQFLYIYPT